MPQEPAEPLRAGLLGCAPGGVARHIVRIRVAHYLSGVVEPNVRVAEQIAHVTGRAASGSLEDRPTAMGGRRVEAEDAEVR